MEDEGPSVTIDERTRSALARLTANEKECLRRRLLPQTAKEMAIELGVSPHAVEKRLKMARAKLGVGSSLQAARLLVASEDQMLVPHRPDLAPDDATGNAPLHPGGSRRWLIPGAITMSIIVAASLALTLAGTPAPQDAPKQTVTERVPATPATATAFLGSSFDTMDKNKSGYLEPEEMPRMSVSSGSVPKTALDPKRAQALFTARNDVNGDGKVSRAEFIQTNRPMIEANGVPARWKARN
ncbi:EF-hand domain-containing protein [Sphingomonas sp. AOB5]|uniref:EF-hand domain-containing protein n=1 Tax=Sphingomonas sp. AOB5 TaxID=3034017 RepID=UPI0023F8F7BE|nr:EF-hand domain-containing protein [Sphingomonas sp. AOB5]MDF7777025.1 EF-hand domain-containing protein [Sphingomonas sp. AOB5]